jgi:D-alanyl-D-alanine carboxypeptidase
MKNFLCIVFLCFLLLFTSSLSSASESPIPDIDAICAVAIDGNTGKILFAKNPHLKIPPASTVKLVTAMVVLDHLSLSKKVKISKNAAQTPSVYPKLYENEVYTVKDLLYLLLMKSSNQAAVALAEAVAGSEESFSVMMNKKIHSLGLKNSHFVTASGLPAPNQYTTPYELAIIFYEALKYPIIKEIINTPVKIITSKTGRTLVIKNTNKLLNDPEIGKNIIGGKTGFTRASKHCLVNGVYIKDRLIITSVLGSPNRNSLWSDSKNLINFAKMVITRQTTPVYITTVVNSSILVNSKYKYKNSRSKVYKKSKKKYNKKRTSKKKVFVKSKKSSMVKNTKVKNNSRS